MTLYEMNLQALLEQNLSLGTHLFSIATNKDFNVYMDEKEPLNINIAHVESAQVLYDTIPLQETIEAVDVIEGRYKRYPYLYFFGLGNGVFYKLLLQNELHSRIVVIEPEIEILYIVLNCISFREEIASGRLVLVWGGQMGFPLAADLFNDPQSKVYSKLFRLEILNSFYERNYSDAILEANRIFIKTIEHSVTAIGNDSMDSLIGMEHHLMNVERMVKTPTLQEMFDKSKTSKTAILVSTGPSLAKQLPLLKKIQHHVTIFCVDASFPILVREGIKPDVVVAIERVAPTGRFFAEVSERDQEGVIFCVTSIVHPYLLKNIKAGTLQMSMRPFGYTRYFDLPDYGYAGIGMSAANMAFEIIFHSKFETCIIIGQDLAYGADGKTHSSGHIFGEIESAEKEDDLNVVAYGGNGIVRTRKVWSLFKNFFEADIHYTKNNGLRTINSTEGGARIEGAEEITFDEAVALCVDQSIQKSPILLDNPTPETILATLELIREKKNQMLTFATRIQEEVNTLFLDVVHTAEKLNEMDAFENHDKVDFNALSVLMERIDRVKNYFADPMFADIFLDAAQAVIMHEEMELAKLEVWEPKTDEDRRNKMISWVKMHGSWLFSLAGIVDAVLIAITREGKNTSIISNLYVVASHISGYIFDIYDSSKVFKVEILIDGECIGVLDNNALFKHYMFNGVEKGRFYCEIPVKFFDDNEHVIIAKEVENGIYFKSKTTPIVLPRSAIVNGIVYKKDEGIFHGWCKKIGISKKQQVEIWIDNQYISSVVADQNLRTTDYLAAGFECEFIYAIPNEFFDEQEHMIKFIPHGNSIPLEKGEFNFILTKELIAQKVESLFIHSVRNFGSNKEIEMNKTKSIGALLVSETLEDINFVEYMKLIQLRFKNINFNFFYFHDDIRQKGEEVFGNMSVRYILTQNIVDIASQSNVFISLDHYKYNRIFERIHVILNEQYMHTLSRLVPKNLYQRVFEKDFALTTKIVAQHYDVFGLNKKDVAHCHVIDLLHKKHIENTDIEFIARDLEIYEYENELVMIECALQSKQYIFNLKKINALYNQLLKALQ